MFDSHINISILILNAEKGNVTVAMNKNDHRQMMNNIINDIMTYQRINRVPTTTMNCLKTTLFQL